MGRQRGSTVIYHSAGFARSLIAFSPQPSAWKASQRRSLRTCCVVARARDGWPNVTHNVTKYAARACFDSFSP